MNIVPVEKNKHIHPVHHETAKNGGGWYQDKKYEYIQSAHVPVISNLERSLAITGALLIRSDLPNYEIIAKAHYFAQVALAEAQMRMNHDLSER